MGRRFVGIRRNRLVRVSIVLSVFGLVAAPNAFAQQAPKKGTAQSVATQAQTYFQGKTITLISPFSIGGSADVTAREFAQYLPQFIPGHPTVIVKDIIGGGGATAMTDVSEVLPADGTNIVVVDTSIPLRRLFNQPGHTYALASMPIVGDIPTSLIVGAQTDVGKTVQALRARSMKSTLTTGYTAPGAIAEIDVTLGLRLLGIPFKNVFGFAGAGAPLALAVQQGQIQIVNAGISGWTKSYQMLADQGIIYPLFQSGKINSKGQIERDPALGKLGKLPTIDQLYRASHHGQAPKGPNWTGFQTLVRLLQLGYAFMLHPNTPSPAVYALREGFQKMLQNKSAVNAMSGPLGAKPEYVSAGAAQSLVHGIFHMSASQVTFLEEASGLQPS